MSNGCQKTKRMPSPKGGRGSLNLRNLVDLGNQSKQPSLNLFVGKLLDALLLRDLQFLLGIDVALVRITERVLEQEIILQISLVRRTQLCGCCGAETERVHDYHIRQVRDLELRGKPFSSTNSRATRAENAFSASSLLRSTAAFSIFCRREPWITCAHFPIAMR